MNRKIFEEKLDEDKKQSVTDNRNIVSLIESLKKDNRKNMQDIKDQHKAETVNLF